MLMTTTTMTEELKAQVERDPRGVVLVVGAGVTIGALPETLRGLAAWRGLIRSGIVRAAATRAMNETEAGRLRALLDQESAEGWIAAAEAVTQALGGPGGGEFRLWLRDTAGRFAQEKVETPALTAIAALAARGVVIATVNYDGVLEAATGLPAVTWREPARVERLLRGDERGILHLHGHWDDPASVVFGGESYDSVTGDPHAQEVMRSIRMLRTMVFVGHGAGLVDPNWGPFLRWTEAVFTGSEYRHFRLARAGEVEKVAAEHPPAQRVMVLPYGEEHADLGPFLAGLVPPGGERRADERRTVVLRVNIGGQEYDWLSEASLRAQVMRTFGDPAPVMLPELHRVVDREAISPREWRSIGRELMALRDAAKEAVPAGVPVRFVVAGVAPLPVFAHLGQLMQRMEGPISFLNRRLGSSEWDVVGPLEGASPGTDLFTVTQPEVGRAKVGRVALSIQCSNQYPYKEEMVLPLIEEEGSHLLCSYEIANQQESHKTGPMTAAEMVVLIKHLRAAGAWMKERCAAMDGLVVALGGPAWAAFWVGFELNPYALGVRVDYFHLVGGGEGRRYARALSSPMHKAPWLAGRAKVLFVGADPDDGSRTRGAKAAVMIQRALERELGRDDTTYDLRPVGQVTVDEFLREIDLFKPDLLHVHVHGTEDGRGLVFEREDGDGQEVPAAALLKMLRSTQARPAVVVLSACNSAGLAPMLVAPGASDGAPVAEVVIAMDGVIDYRVAIDFASSFYGALARGRSLADAVDQGTSRVHACWGEKESEMIRLRCAPGVTAKDVKLLSERASGSAR
jgi:hypothetical protein